MASGAERRLLAFLALRAGGTVRSEVLAEHLDLSAGALALDEFRHECWAMGAATRLDGLRAGANEDRASELIVRRRFDDAIASLEIHIADNPLRDRPRGQLMDALAFGGRTDALRAYQRYRSFLAEEAGTEPSAEVQELERRIVRGVTAKRRVRLAPCPDSVARPGRRPLVMLRA